MSGRIIKDPAVRKQEILDTAMILFHQKGYDATSIADIAKAMNVVPGLCYRYFANKKEIFDAAVKQYAAESCADVLEIVHDHSKSFKERFDQLGHLMLIKEDNSKYHEFYHAPGNETFHLQLSIEMYKQIAPHISRELKRLHEKGEINVENAEFMTEFMLFGQVNLWLSPASDPHSKDFQNKLKQLKRYIYKLLDIQD